MPFHCSVPLCRRNFPSGKEDKIALHRVPPPPLKQLWEEKLKTTLTTSSKVCSRHFASSCFFEVHNDDSSRTKPRLKPGSIPNELRQTCRRKLLNQRYDVEENGQCVSSLSAERMCHDYEEKSVIMKPPATRSTTILIKPRVNNTCNNPNISSDISCNLAVENPVTERHIASPQSLQSPPAKRMCCDKEERSIIIKTPATRSTTILVKPRLNNSSNTPNISSNISCNTPNINRVPEKHTAPKKARAEGSKKRLNTTKQNPTEKSPEEVGVFTFLYVFFVFCACFFYSFICESAATVLKNPARNNPILSEEDLRKKILEENQRKREERKQKKNSENTPRKAKLREKLNKKSRKVKTLMETIYRKSKKVAKMEAIIADLKEKNLMCSEDLDLLKSIGGPHKEFLERQISKVKNIALKRKYGNDLHTFALTLHYKSPAAYEYVRKSFHLALPHPNTIYKWYRVVDGNPGFTDEAFKALREKYALSEGPVFCSLIIDEMSIRKNVETDGTQYHGFVDFGDGLNADNAPLATKALVIMLVCLEGNWKIPLGYFLTAETTGVQLAGLIKTCLRLLNTTKMRVVSLTADGTQCNLSMFRILGCNFNSLTSLKTWFTNPCSKDRIYVFLDTSHMIKLVRNTLGDKGFLVSFQDLIRWSHIKKLFEVQDTEGLRLGNKISSKHIFYGKFKMKVSLATQVLSNSVAAALQVLMILKVHDFADAVGTIRFVKIFNKLFDIFNSKNVKQLGFKAPITRENYAAFKSYLSLCVTYIKNLQCFEDGRMVRVVHSKRKTGFLGFLIAISSLHGLYQMLVEPGIMTFLPMYKFCQDHLEIFFGILRSKNGFNNNPTARQLKSAYKKCLIHMELKPGLTGNCVPLENIGILTCSSKYPERVINVTSPSEYVNELNDDQELQEYIKYYDDIEDKFDHNNPFNPMDLSEVGVEILRFIAGFVVQRLNKVLKCADCVAAINAKPEDRGKSHLITAKNRFGTKKGGTFTEASEDVIEIVKYCEKIVRTSHASSKHQGMRSKDTPEKLVNVTLKFLYEMNRYDRLFSEYEDHFADQETMFQHKFYLVKSICLRFIMLRVHHIDRNTIDNSKSKRQVLNKLILFQGG